MPPQTTVFIASAFCLSGSNGFITDQGFVDFITNQDIVSKNHHSQVAQLMCQNTRLLIQKHMHSFFSDQKNGMNAPPVNFDDDPIDNSDNDSGFGSGGCPRSRRDQAPVYYKPLRDCQNDLDRLHRNSEELDHCGFYYKNMDSNGARTLLKEKPTGTFLVRDSSDCRYLYALSVKTERGATSIRIVYDKGLFQFDSDASVRNHLPHFESVMSLIDFYVLLSRDGGNKLWRWEEMKGSRKMNVLLLQPLKKAVSNLAHLSRVKVNQCLKDVFCPEISVDKLPLGEEQKDFLKNYPYRS